MSPRVTAWDSTDTEHMPRLRFSDLAYGTRFRFASNPHQFWVRIGAHEVAQWDPFDVFYRTGQVIASAGDFMDDDPEVIDPR